MISLLKKMIKSRKYIIVSGASNDFVKGTEFIFTNSKRISDMYDIVVVKYRDKKYVLKCVGNDEWDVVKYLIAKKEKCEQLIEFFACIRKGNKKYVLMQYGEIDLREYYDINPYYDADVFSVMELCFELQRWTIKNLHLVHTDFKLNNLIRIGNGNDNSVKIIDLELMDPADGTHRPDLVALRKKDVDNGMNPRRKCNYQQFGVFSIIIIMMELLSVSDSLISGRSSDDYLYDILDDLSFFDAYPKLLEYCKKVLRLEYDDLETAYQDFVKIKISEFDDRFVLD